MWMASSCLQDLEFNFMFKTIKTSNAVVTPLHKAASYEQRKAKKKKCLCCPLPTDRKMRKNRVGFFFFFFFFMSDLGEEFAKICIQWLKKALA